MKKLIILSSILASITLSAATWTVTTSCGVVGNIQIADNATTQQVAQAVSQYNLTQCGVKPTKITLSIAP